MELNTQRLPQYKSNLTVSLSLWLGLVLIISLANRHLFTVPVYETGDGAANALQIINAKSFQEIYGNYSRWHFYHPGPFFFYIYAFGEILFHDFLPLFPAPANAHTFMGIALQAGFLVVSLHIVAGYFRSSFFLPLALLFALVHFYFVARTIPGSVFLSLWPPHVICFPFMVFLISCASLATGRVQHLPIAVFCGGVLIHGHVAQPLFVIPIGIGSYLGYALNWKKTYPSNSFITSFPVRIYHIIALGIIALFALPIVIDMFKGQESNFYNILQHMEKHRKRKEWIQSLVYVISFFGYLGSQEISIFPLAAIQLFWAMSWFHFLAWFAIIIYTCRCLYVNDHLNPIERRFEIYLTIIIVFALLLSLVWAKRQDGLMFNFNAYFIFSILYCILLILAGRLAVFISVTPKFKLSIFLIACLLSLFTIFQISPHLESSQIMKQIDLALESDPNGRNPKKLSFQDEFWPDAISVALALKRKEVTFYVDSSWGYMFGKKNVFQESSLPFSSIWSISTKQNIDKEIPFLSHSSIIIKPTNSLKKKMN